MKTITTSKAKCRVKFQHGKSVMRRIIRHQMLGVIYHYHNNGILIGMRSRVMTIEEIRGPRWHNMIPAI